MTYLLYDTALNGQYTFMLLRQAYPVYQSLFKGTKDEALSDAAPYLFEVDELVYEKIAGPLVSLKAVVLVQSVEPLEKLCMHFKNFIYQKIDGRENYFRFWDARVLNKFLINPPVEKVEAFFEDIISFSFLEEENNAMQITTAHGKIQKKAISVQELLGSTISKIDVVRQPDEAKTNESPAREINEQTNKPRRRFFYDD